MPVGQVSILLLERWDSQGLNTQVEQVGGRFNLPDPAELRIQGDGCDVKNSSGRTGIRAKGSGKIDLTRLIAGGIRGEVAGDGQAQVSFRGPVEGR